MESPLSILLFFLFPRQFLKINSFVFPFILCTYSSLTPSSKLWANSGIKTSLSFQSRRNVQSTEMSGLAITDLNSCAAPPILGKIARFPSVTHASVPLPVCFSGGWNAALTLCSHAVSALLWLSQNLNQMTSPTGQMGPCWLTDQASSGYLSLSQLLHGGTCCFWDAIRLLSVSHKLCCILVQYGGCISIKAQLHHPHQAEESRWDYTEQEGEGQALVMHNGSRAARQVPLQPLIRAQ